MSEEAKFLTASNWSCFSWQQTIVL